MTAKQYLNRVRRIDKEISALLRLVQKTRESLTTVTQNYDSDGAQNTKNPHKFDRLIELESLVDQKIDDQIALKAEILDTIMKLDDRRQRLVLMEYYIEMKTFEEIAVDIHYSWKQTHRIHAMALKNIEHIIRQ
jgi:DNA-directed RNA polymerase specialized sigma subunit